MLISWSGNNTSDKKTKKSKRIANQNKGAIKNKQNNGFYERRIVTFYRYVFVS